MATFKVNVSTRCGSVICTDTCLAQAGFAGVHARGPTVLTMHHVAPIVYVCMYDVVVVVVVRHAFEAVVCLENGLI